MNHITQIICAISLAFTINGLCKDKAATLYTTSFENLPAGILKKQSDGECEWQSVGKSEITTKFANTGKKCLHIFGGKENTLEVVLKGNLQNSRGISFMAERWTSRNPFKFRILAQINGNWKEVANLDRLVITGRGFKSNIVLKLPHEIIGGLRFVCTAPENAGVLIDDLTLLKGEPENVSKLPEVCNDPIAKLLEKKDLFVSGTEDTHTFRIPAIIRAKNGDLIACADARRKSGADLIWVKDIDIVIKRSSDNGKTWGSMETVIDYGDPKAGKPASDASFILDRDTGEIFCFYSFMDQIKAPKEFRLHVQSSKDHGKTWGFIDTAVKPANESKVIELADETLMINSRLNGKGFRGVHRSSDNGKSWDYEIDKSQVDPGCNGSIIRYTSIKGGYKKNRLLLCHANSASGRKNLVVKISYDEGKSWSKGKVIDPGPSAYSSLTICKDGTIAVLYEPGYKAIRFARFTLEDLTDGKDSLVIPYKPVN